jgi:hypothetical protein
MAAALSKQYIGFVAAKEDLVLKNNFGVAGNLSLAWFLS